MVFLGDLTQGQRVTLIKDPSTESLEVDHFPSQFTFSQKLFPLRSPADLFWRCLGCDCSTSGSGITLIGNCAIGEGTFHYFKTLQIISVSFPPTCWS